MRRLLLLSLPVILAISARPADACSAPQCWPGAFVPGDNATIPENAPGFYWRPSIASGQPADPSTVQLRDVADPGTSLGFTATQLPNGDYLLTPDAPLVAGARYALEDRSICNGTTTHATFTAGPAAPLPTSLGSMGIIGHGNRLPIQVATASGSCSTEVDAEVLGIELVTSADATPWKDLLLYETIVDDQPWSNQASINAPVTPGQSWKGRGADTLYRICKPNADALQPGLAIGGHYVRFRATLPGAATSLATSPTLIELMCDADPDEEEENHPSDGGGCSSSTPASASFVLLALAFLLVTSSRRRRS